MTESGVERTGVGGWSNGSVMLMLLLMLLALLRGRSRWSTEYRCR